MTVTDTITAVDGPAAGTAWGHAALDWAALFEPYARDAIESLFASLAVGPDVDLLDVACGSGLALARADRLGATDRRHRHRRRPRRASPIAGCPTPTCGSARCSSSPGRTGRSTP